MLASNGGSNATTLNGDVNNGRKKGFFNSSILPRRKSFDGMNKKSSPTANRVYDTILWFVMFFKKYYRLFVNTFICDTLLTSISFSFSSFSSFSSSSSSSSSSSLHWPPDKSISSSFSSCASLFRVFATEESEDLRSNSKLGTIGMSL